MIDNPVSQGVGPIGSTLFCLTKSHKKLSSKYMKKIPVRKK
jgi:hypothetical protein